MKCNINSTSGKTGLDKIAYTTKPVQVSDFNFSEEIDFENNPHNPIDLIGQIINNFKTMIDQKQKNEMQQSNYVTITSD